MIDISFTYADLEFFLLILVRVTCFVHVAPFFGMNNTPRRVKIGLSVFIAYLLFFNTQRWYIITPTADRQYLFYKFFKFLFQALIF